MYAIKLTPGMAPEIVELSNGVQAELAGAPYAVSIDPAGLFFAFVDEMAQLECAGEGGYYCRATHEHLYGTVFVTRHDCQLEPCSIHAEDIGRVIGLLKEFDAWEENNHASDL